MSSPYPVLYNRSIDQWKVTELKEELKRRKLMTKGLKDDLIKRLDEAIRNESEVDQRSIGDSSNVVPHPEVGSEDADIVPVMEKTAKEMINHSGNRKEVDGGAILVHIDDSDASLSVGKVQEDAMGDGDSARNKELVVHATSVESSDTVTENVVSVALSTEESDIVPVMEKTATDMINHCDNRKEVDGGAILVHIDESAASLSVGKVQEDAMGDGDSARNEELVVHATSGESSVTVAENVVSVALSAEESQNIESKNEKGNMEPHMESEDPKLQEDVVLKSFDTNDQVSEVSPVLGFQVKSDSIAADCVSINEKNKLKDNLIDDNVTLEQDVKSKMLPPSSSTVVQEGGETHLMDVEEQCESKVSIEEKDGDNPLIADVGKKNNSANIVPPENLNAEQNFGDESMEPDALESKQSDSKYNSDEVEDGSQKTAVPIAKEYSPVDIVQDHLLKKKKDIHLETEIGLAAFTAKRKLQDQETVGNNEVIKRQRKWNSESLNVPEPQSLNFASSTTPKDTILNPTSKRNFSRSESTVSEDAPKERVVPPSPRPPTNSLRIDRFLRPFTLKAVQELLGKTGSFTSFWMDHIKTHCYVTYTSVEEAMETRNALYNLQWPPNGGRFLVAEFVDPQEVKMRVEAPSLTPTTPVGTGPAIAPAPPAAPQPSPRQHVQRPQLPTPPSLPPPPLSIPSQARETLPLRSPSSLPEKVELPIVTLDDLFRKTKATPRIYYLALSDEQVAAKLKAQGENDKQSAGVACRMELLQTSYGRSWSWSWSDDGFGYIRRLLWVEAEVNLGLEHHKFVFLFVCGSIQPCSPFVSLGELQLLALSFIMKDTLTWPSIVSNMYLSKTLHLSIRFGNLPRIILNSFYTGTERLCAFFFLVPTRGIAWVPFQEEMGARSEIGGGKPNGKYYLPRMYIYIGDPFVRMKFLI